MATKESSVTPSKNASKAPISIGRKIGYAVLVILLLGLIWLIFSWNGIKNSAHVGTAYGAHIVCSCRYIEGRDLESCKTDLEDGMESISLSDDPENKRISASLSFLSEAVAEKRGEFGCIILNEAEMDALN